MAFFRKNRLRPYVLSINIDGNRATQAKKSQLTLE